jgi:hypothetical protein
MVKLVVEDIIAAVNASEPGGYIEVAVPYKSARGNGSPKL